ncbi:MAG: cobaltochelatase subunit CobN, partial [Pseudomonadota bacterium]
MRAGRLIVLGLLAVLPVGNACAANLFGVVSERNSAVAAEASEQFEKRFPDHQVILRTPRQLAGLDDRTISRLLADADAVLIAGVFGEDAARVGRLVEAVPASKRLFAVSSASTLVEQSKQRFVAGSSVWDTANAYWQGRGVDNLANLFAFASQDQPQGIPEPHPLRPIRSGERLGPNDAPLVVLFDYETGDLAGNVDLHEALCEALLAHDLACRSVFADWGSPSAEALEQIRSEPPAAVVMLQDFAVGGSDRDRATAALMALDVPVLKGIRLNESDRRRWQRGSEGLPTDSVYYRVAMPELSGTSQPFVLALSEPPRIDPVSGIEVRVTAPVPEEVASASRRIARWTALQQAENAEKRLAIVYYNHPPGRHNIGADNLDVPQSLFEILQRLRAEGYEVGELPESPEALLEQIQQEAVNLPENNAALVALQEAGLGHPSGPYRAWLGTLPEWTRAELIDGPLAALEHRVDEALVAQDLDAANEIVGAALHDMAYVIEGAPARYHERAEALLDQLRDAYTDRIGGQGDAAVLADLTRALQNQGIEGLRGWGAVPGAVMTVVDEFVFPHLRFGNVIIAPQPPRGWEVNEEVLHANLSVPPTH